MKMKMKVKNNTYYREYFSKKVQNIFNQTGTHFGGP